MLPSCREPSPARFLDKVVLPVHFMLSHLDLALRLVALQTRLDGVLKKLGLGRFRVSWCQDADGSQTHVDKDISGKLKPG